MLDTLLKLLSLEEFKKVKRESTFGFKETADGYSCTISYGSGRLYCNWQEDYQFYCKQRQAYIEKTTPIYNFLKKNKGKSYSLEELRQKLNDNTIRSGTMLCLIKNNIVKRIEVSTTNEKGQHIIFMKYQINQTEED